MTLPVQSPDDSRVLDVDVYHFHRDGTPGALLTSDWTSGSPTARVELRDFSIIGMTLVYAGLT